MSADDIQRAREGGPDMGPAAIRGDLGSIPAYDAMAAAISAHDRSSAAAHHGMAAAITSHDRSSAARRAVAAALNPLHRSSAAAHHGMAADMHEYESDDDLLEPEQFLAIRQNPYDDEFSILTKWKDKTEDFNDWVPISSFFMQGYEHKLIPFLDKQGYAIDRSHGAPTIRKRTSAQPHSDRLSYADFVRASAVSDKPQKVPPLYIRGFSLDNSSGQTKLISNGQPVAIHDQPKHMRKSLSKSTPSLFVTGFSIDNSVYPPVLRRNGTRVRLYDQPSSQRKDFTSDKEEFEVEQLLGHKLVNEDGNREDKFLVKWRGYDNSHNTWEPRSELMRNCRDLVLNYEKEHADEIEPLRD